MNSNLQNNTMLLIRHDKKFEINHIYDFEYLLKLHIVLYS